MGILRLKKVTIEYIRNMHNNMTTDDLPVPVITAPSRVDLSTGRAHLVSGRC